MPGVHVALARQAAALAEIAGAAGGHDVLPGCPAAAAARNDMVEGQVRRRLPLVAVLAGEGVAQEHVEPREGRLAGGGDVVLQRDHAGQAHGDRGGAHFLVVFVQHRHAVKEHRFHGILPTPHRKRKIRERPEVGIQD